MTTVCRLVLSQRNQESIHPLLPQQPRNVRRSKRPLTIGEETGQKEQPISDGSDFVSGYSDDSDHLSQGDDNGLVAEVMIQLLAHVLIVVLYILGTITTATACCREY